MKLFTLCPDAYNKDSHLTYKPSEGIHLNVVRDVPCITVDAGYGKITNSVNSQESNSDCHILLPVVLKESTKKELQFRREESPHSWSHRNPILINYVSLHTNSNGVRFLKEEDCFEDEYALVSLNLPLTAAQPYYNFEGNFEVLIGSYATYYGSRDSASGRCEVEKEDALCSAIVKLENEAKISLTYTNRYRQGQIIENLVGYKFEFICSNGQLLRLDDYSFYNLYSNFTITKD